MSQRFYIGNLRDSIQVFRLTITVITNMRLFNTKMQDGCLFKRKANAIVNLLGSQ
jgi:hypothetical protein